jgi:hypothetical protein
MFRAMAGTSFPSLGSTAALALFAVLLAYMNGCSWLDGSATLAAEPLSLGAQLHRATLTTYFLAASKVQLVQIDEGQSLYELSFPLSAAAEWTPVTTPHLESGMHCGYRVWSYWVILGHIGHIVFLLRSY